MICQHCGQVVAYPVPDTLRSHITPEDIILSVADYFKVSIGEMKGFSRKEEFCYPRQVAMHFLCLLKKRLHIDQRRIGLMFGGRDHTSVLKSARRIKGFLDVDDKVRDDVNNIRKLLA